MTTMTQEEVYRLYTLKEEAHKNWCDARQALRAKCTHPLPGLKLRRTGNDPAPYAVFTCSLCDSTLRVDV